MGAPWSSDRGAWIRLNAKAVHLDARNINNEITNILGRKVASITQDPDLRKTIGEYYIAQVTPYVPMKTGALRESGTATTDGRVYWSALNTRSRTGPYNYAAVQYHTQYKNYTTPGTGPYWNEHVQPGSAGWEEFIDAITPIIKRRFDDG